MYNGVKAMIQKEKELKPKEEHKEEAKKAPVAPKEEKKSEEEKGVLVGSHLKKPEEVAKFPLFPAGTKSLLSKYLTKEVWKKLKNT
jgi:hypothetical protein